MRYKTILMLASMLTTELFTLPVLSQLRSPSSFPRHDFTFVFQAPVKNLPQHPQVTPPVPDMEIHPEQISVFLNPNAPTLITLGNGNHIIIPPAAFETMNGTPVKGNITITYREFKDPLSIFLSGIPMKYDSGGQNHLFQSAGMFEITASQENASLQLKKDKTIQVQFAPVDNGGYQFYRLNESDGNWSHVSPVANQNNARNNTTNTISRQSLPDTTCFANRYTDTLRYFTWDKGLQKDAILTLVNYSHRKVFPDGKPILYEWHSVRVNTPLFKLMPEVNKEKIVEYVRFYEAPNACIFPELKVFPFKNWVLADNMLYRDYIRNFKRGRRYYDIRIIYQANADYCEMQLKCAKGFCTLKIDLAKSLHCNSSHAKAKFSKYFKRYSVVLKNRENHFNSILANKYRTYLGNIAMARASEVFTVAKLGVYNCDRLYTQPMITSTPVLVFPDSSTTFLKIATIDKKANAAFWFYGGEIKIAPEFTTAIVVLNPVGTMYYAPSSEVQKISAGNQKPEIFLRVIPENCNQPLLAQLLGLDTKATELAGNR